ncbi:MAG: PKD domain-containing protein, partial [Candidatus Peribacteraceae bacterium]|nr:PKD domain-containing protein [Candidatus Peribacteraceae bacterium]
MSSAYAQNPNNTIQIELGSVFEIVADIHNINSEVNWILLKDNTFIQADRSLAFSFRPRNKGQYNLVGEISLNGKTTARKEFDINVTSRGTEIAQAIQNSEVKSIVKTDPIIGENSAINFKDIKNLLHIFSIRNDVDQILMDTNMEFDMNGDGDSVNDNILSDSLFSNGGKDIFLWLPFVEKTQKLLIGARLNNGSIATQIITLELKSIRETNNPSNERGEPREGEIFTKNISDTKKQFSLEIPKLVSQGKSVLTLWSFGDGQQSLITNPEYEYAENGSYKVSVEVRDTKTGEIIYETQTTLSILIKNIPTDNSGETDGTLKDDEKESDKRGLIPLLLLIGKATIALIVAIIIGALITFIISKFKGSSIQEKLEQVEKEHFSDDESNLENPPPMQMPDTPEVEVTEAPPATPKEEAKGSKVAEKPKEVVNEVPSWLASAPKEAEEAK